MFIIISLICCNKSFAFAFSRCIFNFSSKLKNMHSLIYELYKGINKNASDLFIIILIN